MSPLDTSKGPLQLGFDHFQDCTLEIKTFTITERMDNWTHTLLVFLFSLPIYRFDLFFQLFDFSSPIFDILNLFVERKIIIKNQRTKQKMMVCLLRNEYPQLQLLSGDSVRRQLAKLLLLTCSRLVPLTAMGYNNKQMQ